MSKELEKALENWVASRKEGHETFIRLFEQWGKDFNKQLQEIEKLKQWIFKKCARQLGLHRAMVCEEGAGICRAVPPIWMTKCPCAHTSRCADEYDTVNKEGGAS
ncbi:hypothetical protein LR69_03040 [Geobacillus sp. BCO2]|nr:hypothetical protein LR69_03040 [Geobacillus sp. BCO2]